MRGRRGRLVATAALLATLALVAGCQPVPDPSAGMTPEQTVALIDRTPRSALSAQAVADAYAFGSRTTEAQRKVLLQSLVGHVVEWDLTVAQMGFGEGRFEVLSQKFPIGNADTVPVLLAKAFVLPRGDDDMNRLMRLRTEDVVRVRGIVQEVRDERVVAIVPAVLATTTPALPAPQRSE